MSFSIIKRDGTKEQYQVAKIKRAVEAAFKSTQLDYTPEDIEAVVYYADLAVINSPGKVTIEDIHDIIEMTLMDKGYFAAAKNYILYRDKKSTT